MAKRWYMILTWFSFARHTVYNMLTVFNSLKILQRAEYIEYSEESNIASRVHFLAQKMELYNFQIKNEQFDAFIKLLLRSYTGFFTEYVVINEQMLAQRANVHVDLIYKYLNKLDHLKIIHYIPAKKTPLIQYTQPREELRYLKLPDEVYKDRKKQYEQRIKAVIEYAEFTHVCRSRYLLLYFGQKNAEECGQCDVCLDKKKRGLHGEEAKLIEEMLRTTLINPTSFDELGNLLNLPEKKWITVFNWLADNELIVAEEDGKWVIVG